MFDNIGRKEAGRVLNEVQGQHIEGSVTDMPEEMMIHSEDKESWTTIEIEDRHWAETFRRDLMPDAPGNALVFNRGIEVPRIQDLRLHETNTPYRVVLGVLGCISLISGCFVVVVTNRVLVCTIDGLEIYSLQGSNPHPHPNPNRWRSSNYLKSSPLP